MVIFHFCNVFNQSNGIYAVLKNLVPEQRKLGNTVEVFNVSKKGIHDDEMKFCNYSDFKQLIENIPPDIVIFHGIFYHNIIPMSHYLRIKKIPYLIELHGALSQQNMQTSTMKKKVVNSLFLNNIIKRARGIIYLNECELTNSTIGKLNQNNLIIPNGCVPTPLTAFHKYDGILKLIFMGRVFRQHKGLDILIPAVKLAINKGIRLHLSIYGRGDDTEIKWLKEELEGYENVIDYFGEVHNEDKQKAFLNSDIFILTSRYEGFPVAILEALSYGIPCIVTPATNVADIIEENNCGIVTNFTIEDIYLAIKDFANMSRTHFNEMVNRGRILANMYSWASIGKRSVEEYKSIIKSS